MISYLIHKAITHFFQWLHLKNKCVMFVGGGIPIFSSFLNHRKDSILKIIIIIIT